MKNKPGRIPFLTANWCNLIVINYEIDPTILKSFVPQGTELDSFQGKYFVSMVGFLFKSTKLFGLLPAFPAQTFEEINLRFYVKRTVGTETRRAVCFVKEIVPSRLMAWTARIFYNENYIAMPTKHEWHWNYSADHSSGGSFSYQWQDGLNCGHLLATTQGQLWDLKLGTLESFILEHYWGYVKQKDGGTKEYGVWHPSWKYWNTASSSLTANIAQLYGNEFVSTLTKPHSAFVALGSEVAVYPGSRITKNGSNNIEFVVD